MPIILSVSNNYINLHIFRVKDSIMSKEKKVKDYKETETKMIGLMTKMGLMPRGGRTVDLDRILDQATMAILQFETPQHS